MERLLKTSKIVVRQSRISIKRTVRVKSTFTVHTETYSKAFGHVVGNLVRECVGCWVGGWVLEADTIACDLLMRL